jgi:hypothetical protein
MAQTSANSSGIVYQNDSQQIVIVTLGVRPFGSARFAPTADPADEVSVESNQLEFRTYQIDPGQGIRLDTEGSVAVVSLEISLIQSVVVTAPPNPN